MSCIFYLLEDWLEEGWYRDPALPCSVQTQQSECVYCVDDGDGDGSGDDSGYGGDGGDVGDGCDGDAVIIFSMLW